MGYAVYGTPLGDAGYGVADVCHEQGCSEEIDRGLAYLCGDEPGRTSECGCGRWFCEEHLYGGFPRGRCKRCLAAAGHDGSDPDEH